MSSDFYEMCNVLFVTILIQAWHKYWCSIFYQKLQKERAPLSSRRIQVQRNPETINYWHC